MCELSLNVIFVLFLTMLSCIPPHHNHLKNLLAVISCFCLLAQSMCVTSTWGELDLAHFLLDLMRLKLYFHQAGFFSLCSHHFFIYLFTLRFVKNIKKLKPDIFIGLADKNNYISLKVIKALLNLVLCS